ncbi:peptide/nickel transport system ATP-binding protein [Murinocardiopsis flavida]|uniref:Peptide/nickel transport system ATP-binding protein n=1 Tax=Murinocardiopsis flavida TaxID=645275 RepID=A0A2P8DF70_9ACTN|nr:ABC transporter ATP-binding protein [Murinocardiopsis flavida]PSK95865.1 peptide/nickel transport system ATP-binding protein [Murinocardiopsis flavida]
MSATADTPTARAAAAPVLRTAGLTVEIPGEHGEAPVRAAVGVDLEVRPSEVLALVGESGSGKSVSTMSILGLVPRGASVAGSVVLDGRELVGLDARGLRGVRGKEAAVIFQEPMTSLNPVFTVGWQLREVLRLHMGATRAQAHDRSRELLELVGLDAPERRLRAYPHQLSGGQRQRVMIAMAVACDPKVLIADEPTTALDVTVQAEILDLLRDLRDRLGTAIVLITHDMGVVADIADRVAVMYKGEIVETGDVHQVLGAPRHAYTRRLLAAVPHLGAKAAAAGSADTADTAEDRAGSPAGAAEDHGGAAAADSPEGVADARASTAAAPSPADAAPAAAERPLALDVRDLVVDFGSFRAVKGVSIGVAAGEIVGLVGESGSGKSTLGRCAAGLTRAESGTVALAGTDISGLSRRRMRPLRRNVQMVFQDPASSLNPRMTAGDAIAEPLRRYGIARGAALAERVGALLADVALAPDTRHRYPHQMSGGQRQRVAIARALALEPALLIADEPTSALDVSVQAEVLELITGLQRRLGFACLFISHDLAVVEILAGRVAVMRNGEIVEEGPTARILHDPHHPYTRALVSAAPVPDPVEQRRRTGRRHSDDRP